LLFENFEVCCIENLLFISFGDFKGCVVDKKNGNATKLSMVMIYEMIVDQT
jgi:hypothetical protein